MIDSLSSKESTIQFISDLKDQSNEEYTKYVADLSSEKKLIFF